MKREVLQSKGLKQISLSQLSNLLPVSLYSHLVSSCILNPKLRASTNRVISPIYDLADRSQIILYFVCSTLHTEDGHHTTSISLV